MIDSALNGPLDLVATGATGEPSEPFSGVPSEAAAPDARPRPDHHPAGAPDLPTVYIVVTGDWGEDWAGVAVTAEGFLWGHVSSSLTWLRADLTDGFPHRKNDLAMRFPDGYRVVVVGRNEPPPAEIAHFFEAHSAT